MKTTHKHHIAIAVASFGLATLPFLSGTAQAKDHNPGHHDNGKHLGWDKGQHNGWDNSNRDRRNDWDDRRDRRDDRRDDRDDRRDSRNTPDTNWRNNTVQHQWSKWRTSPARQTYVPARRVNYRSKSYSRRPNTSRPFGTRASAERAAAVRRRLGYHTSVNWNPRTRTYEEQEFGRTLPRSSTRRTSARRAFPVSAGNLAGTHYYPTQAAAAAGMRFAQSKGYRATSTYDRANNRWIVRTYMR
jgi:hypothetical protein